MNKPKERKPAIHVGIKLSTTEHSRLGIIAASIGSSRSAIAKREVIRFLAGFGGGNYSAEGETV
jgi:hypothetical protein